jgi:hypothetical protein
MIDGSDGETLTVRVDLEGNSLDHPTANHGYILDVPVGPYRASAIVVLPDGDEVPLRFLAECPYGAEDRFTPTADVDFRPMPTVEDIDAFPLCVTDR